MWRLLVFKAQDPNVEWCTKVAAAIQNAIQCYHVNYDEKKSTTTQTSLDHFFKRVDRIESNKEPEPVSSTSGMSEIVVCLRLLLLTVLQLHHLSPPLLPPVSSSSCLFTGCQPLDARCCTMLLLFKVLYCKIKNVFFIFCVCFLCIICVKSMINLLQYSTTYSTVIVGYPG